MVVEEIAGRRSMFQGVVGFLDPKAERDQIGREFCEVWTLNFPPLRNFCYSYILLLMEVSSFYLFHTVIVHMD